jgi:hypothetical protein
MGFDGVGLDWIGSISSLFFFLYDRVIATLYLPYPFRLRVSYLDGSSDPCCIHSGLKYAQVDRLSAEAPKRSVVYTWTSGRCAH